MDKYNDITEEEFKPSAAPFASAVPVKAEEAAEKELKRTIISDEFVDESAAFEKTPPPKKNLLDRIRENPDFGIYAASVSIAAVIVCGAFIAGQSVHRDPDSVEERYAQIRRTSGEYNDLLAKIDSDREKLDGLYQERDRVKTEADALTGYAARSGEVESSIAAMEDELNRLKSDNWAKQAEISSLSGSVAERKAAAIFNLTPGMYTVGEDADIPPGRYSVTGSGKLTVSNSGGAAKTNTVLTADGTEVELEEKDRIQLDTRAKFTAAAKAQEGTQ